VATVVAAAASALPAVVQAQFTFTTNTDGSLTITGYSGPGGNVIIPGSISGSTVTSIGTYAFTPPGDPFSGPAILKIAVPSSVTNLNHQAFAQIVNYGGAFVGLYFQGNAPAGTNAFDNFVSQYPTVYYLPGMTGWGTNFDGRPTQEWYPGELIMTLSPANAIIDGAEWQVDGGAWQTNGGMIDHWRVVRSCRFFQSEDSGVTAADKADFGGEEFLERKAFG